ncbi:MAG: M48 family metallopeptidase, partial [Micromonosporaceae bacterium]
MITIRAALAVALLGGYWYGRYLTGCALVVLSGWLWITNPGMSAALLSAVAVPLVVLSARASRVVRGSAVDEPSGTVIPQRADSMLWTEVRSLCERLDVRVPDEVRLGGEPMVVAWQRASRLGLTAGFRGLYVGLPALVGLSPAQLRALLTHELAHDAHQAGRLVAVCHRARATLGPMLAVRPRTTGVVFAVWARLFLALEAPVSRHQELLADRAAVAVTSRASTAGALRELPVLGVAWRRYVTEVIAPAARSGYAPLSLTDGFVQVRAAWSEELEQLRTVPQEEARPGWDVHPARLERLHAIDLAPESPGGAELVELRPKRSAVVREVEGDVIGGGEVRRLPWDEFCATIASEPLRAEVAELYAAAGEVASTGPGGVIEHGKAGLDTVLGLIERGALPELEQRLQPPVRGLLAVAFALAAVDG